RAYSKGYTVLQRPSKWGPIGQAIRRGTTAPRPLSPTTSACDSILESLANHSHRCVQRAPYCQRLLVRPIHTTLAANMSSQKWYLNQTVDESDPELFKLIQNEKRRQNRGLEMIASENFTSLSVLQCLSSCLHNKYSEGYPGQRFVTHVMSISSLCVIQLDTLRGPRAGVIFYRKGVKSVSKTGEKELYDFEDKINQAVFPGLQGGPHDNTIAGIATAMKQAATPEFAEYQKQVIKNAATLVKGLQSRGYTCVTGGTDNHLVWVDLRPKGLNGARAERVLEEISIACNKNTVPGDKSALNPGGIRLGTPALTTRGLNESDIEKVVDYIDEGLKLAQEIKAASPGVMLKDFFVTMNSEKYHSKIVSLRENIESFAEKFQMPGYEDY
ncbi:unnamed protein product, partial [Medioppia subpectinata]